MRYFPKYHSVLFMIYGLLQSLSAEPIDNDRSFNNQVAGLFQSRSYPRQGLLDTMGLQRKTYAEYSNQCSKGCDYRWLGDHWCDAACAVPECDDDGNDCYGWCAPDCPTIWIGDHHCDIDCYREECQFDLGDCKGKIPAGHRFFNSLGQFNISLCKCDHSLLNNSICNEECRTPECNFDLGDCRHECSPDCGSAWLGDGICDAACNKPECNFDKGDCRSCNEKCLGTMLGNGVCDQECNNEACHYDSGDCHGICWTPDYINYTHEPFFYPHCRNQWIGDGFCDCYCLTPQCDFDLGDCDGMDCSYETEYLRQTYLFFNNSVVNFNPYNETADAAFY